MSKQKIIIIITVFLDVVGVGLVIPILPIYVQSLTNSEFLTMALFSVYSFCGFFSAPILGSLSDRYGRRPILLISLLGTAIGWFLFAIGGNLLFLVLGRIIDGITSGNIATAQSYLIDISKDEKERTANLGLIGASFGIGFIVAPVIGAVLATISLTTPFWAAAFLSLANTIAAYFYLPETNVHKDRSRALNINPLRGLKKAFMHSNLSVLFFVWFLFTMTFSSMQTIFSLFTNLVFGLSASCNGVLLAIMGSIIAFNQGFLIRKVWIKCNQPRLEIVAAIGSIIAYILMSLQMLWLFIVGIIILGFSQALLRIINNSEISGAAPKNERGEMIGVLQSIMFLSAIIAPLIGGIVFEYNHVFPWILNIMYLSIAVVLLVIRHKKIEVIKPVMTIDTPIEEMIEV